MYRPSPSFNFDLTYTPKQEVPNDLADFVFEWQEKTGQFFIPPATMPTIQDLLAIAPFLQSPLPTTTSSTRTRRTLFSKYQIEILELHFIEERTPRPPMQYFLSIMLDIPEDKIRSWFTNRRAKQKKLDAKIIAAEAAAQQQQQKQQKPEYSPSYANNSPPGYLNGQSNQPVATMIRPAGQPNFPARPVNYPRMVSPGGQSEFPTRPVSYPSMVSPSGQPDFPARSPNYPQMVSPGQPDFPARPVSYPRMVSPGGQSEFPARPVSYPRMVSPSGQPDFPGRSPNYPQMVSPSGQPDFPTRSPNYPQMVSPGVQFDFPTRAVSHPQMVRPAGPSYMQNQRPIPQNWPCTSPNYYPNFPMASPPYATNAGFYENCANSNFKSA